MSLLTASGRAQSSAASARIVITVSDPQGALIAGAKLTLKNADLGQTRSGTSDAEGRCIFSGLPAGNYSLDVQATSFAARKLPRLPANAGSTVELELKLQIAAAREELTVTGSGATVEGNTAQPAVNRSEPETGNDLAGLTVTYLPSRGRDLTQLAQLAAGVTPGADAFGVVIAGQRPENSETAVDGADFNDPLQGGQRGARDGTLFFPQTVVRELQVIRAGAGAEIGSTNAGFINIATKEGSNKIRGEFFYLGRPGALTGRDAFDHSLPSSQNQFGGSLGGPIRRNRAFFYAGAEQDFLHVPYETEFAPQAPGTVIPAPLASLEQAQVQKSSPTALFVRGDLMVNASNTVNLQANFNRIYSASVNEGSTRTVAAPGHSDSWSGTGTWLRASLATVLGTDTNQVLAQWSRDRRDLRPDNTSPELSIDGFGILGGDALAPASLSSQRRQLRDDLELTRGKALLRLGAHFAQDPVRQLQEANLNGRFDYSSLADFLAGTPRRFRQTFLNGDAALDGAIRQLGFYASSSYKLSNTFNVSAGLRWDGQWNPLPQRPNPALAQTRFVPDDFQQWQPRLGLAWNPRTSTMVRATAGLYDAPTPAAIYQRVFTDNGVDTITLDSFFDPFLLPLAGLPTPHPLAAVPPAVTLPQAEVLGISPAFRNPRSFQASANIEQEISRKITFLAGYLRNSTWDLPLRLDRNLLPPPITSSGLPLFPSRRPIVGVGRLLVMESAAHSSYDAGVFTAILELPRRSQLTANYTLARTRDNAASGGTFAPDLTLNPFNPAGERAYSLLDARHNFNLNAVVNLVWGLKINPVIVARSGLPYTPIVGLDINHDANDWNDRSVINGAVSPRNIFRQPALFNLDLRFVKDFRLTGEGRHLDLFMDIFNLTGAPNRNFGPYGVSLFGPAAAPLFSAGQPLSAPDAARFGSVRQVQFTARIVAF